MRRTAFAVFAQFLRKEDSTHPHPFAAPLLLALSIVLLGPSLALARSALRVLFSLDHPVGGPFPSDLFTVADSSHNTGLRVNLPLPDCEQRPSDCEDLAVINTLDGFNLQPRLSIPFSSPIDVAMVTSDTVFLIRLGSALPGWLPGGLPRSGSTRWATAAARSAYWWSGRLPEVR